MTTFAVNTCQSFTSMIGNTDSTMYSSVINSPESEASRSSGEGRGVTPRNPNNGMANITTYVSA